jgi:hypothetical protein
VLVILGGACNVTKHLDPEKGELLLADNKLEIQFDDKPPRSSVSSLQYELAGLYKTKPNTKMLGLFPARLWNHYRFRGRASRTSKFIVEKFSEPPALFDKVLSERTAGNFVNYMAHRGFFDATCTVVADTLSNPRKVRAVYNLNAGSRFRIDTVEWVSTDSAILALIHGNMKGTGLRKGAPVDGSVFEKEKLRLTNMMKNNGYAFFAPNFIDFEADTTGKMAKISVDILPFSDTSSHPTYTIGEIQVVTNVVAGVTAIRTDTTINDIYYASSEQKFAIRPDKLQEAIVLQQGQPFNQSIIDQTTRNLNALGTYRFVSIRNFTDSTDASRQDILVSLTPNKHFTIGGNLELNTSNSAASAQLIGVATGVNVRNRNIFGGAESWGTDATFNVEFDVFSPRQLIFSEEFRLNNQLTFPRFFDYLRWWKTTRTFGIGSWKLVSDRAYERVRTEAQTNLKINYNYIKLIDFYSYNLVNASFGYALQSNPGSQYSIDMAGFEMLLPELQPRFDSAFGNNNFFLLSFQEQLFTGLLFRNLNMSFYSNPNKFGEHNFLRFNAELSGLEVEIANEIWSRLFNPSTWQIGRLSFARFVRLNLDAGYTRDLPGGKTVALRIGSGVARPFGGTAVTPYVKQFSVGGPSSIRAFRIREIGPGGYRDVRAPQFPPFYQAADFRFEFNAEYRFPLFWVFKGAVFIDGGNIWSLDKNDPRADSQLKWDSFKQIALGTGFGLRLDADFVIIRFDLGLPVRRPLRQSGEWVNYFKDSPLNLRDFNLNLSVGYPF